MREKVGEEDEDMKFMREKVDQEEEKVMMIEKVEEEKEEEENDNKLGEFWCYVKELCSKEIGHVMKKKALLTTASLFLTVLFMAAFLVPHFIDSSIFTGNPFLRTSWARPRPSTKRIIYHLNCTRGATPQTCPVNNASIQIIPAASDKECPEYFRWIQEDLQPWKKEGITREVVESAQTFANYRVVVVAGKIYYKRYFGCFQTRDVFALWGIVQLLRLYPGMVPDLDMMFQCNDFPAIKKKDYGRDDNNNITKTPPTLFHYCGDDSSQDIVFPDWSFWGWPELNIKPWEQLKRELKRGNKMIKWKKRQPFAYWKGNVGTGNVRGKLFKCNGANKHDWNAQIFNIDWGSEIQKGFKYANLAKQCTHRYKIYAEGNTWSVSEKYILACDSMSLMISPRYHDFFTRSLLPKIHYWPIKSNDMCRSIKFAVDWGNHHTQQAQEIGKAGTKFIEENLKMKNVYDYMFHLFKAYSELLKYRPTIPEGAVELCSEITGCEGGDLVKRFKMLSMVKSPSITGPCSMPSLSELPSLQDFFEKKENLTKQVEGLEASGKV